MDESGQGKLRHKLFNIIFEADTPAGKAFDVGLLALIVLSVILVMLESVDAVRIHYQRWFTIGEWIITVLFTVEYGLRIWLVKKSWKYIFSFYGVVDLLSLLPTYLSPFFGNTQYLLTIRALRLLRVFRILKMAQYILEGQILIKALKASRTKITVFIMAVLTVVMIVGSLMYVVEGTANSGFTSIPRSVYWAIVTVTTVGYGDISPVTPLGQFLSSILMITGYAVLAVPTGIVSVELANVAAEVERTSHTQVCPSCSKEGHDHDAKFCKHCGHFL
ncbi:MAG: ion transporter [Bacteroidia bacterium]|nr:ion transporter [Bacteroidia bacterium]